MTIRTLPFPKIREGRDEPILEPDLPIVDSHHHLFDRPALRYMPEQYFEDVGLGHDIRATIYIETQAMARPDGPETLRPVGEIEFANGVGAMGASGVYGPCRLAAAIVGFADMTLGDRAAETMDRSLGVAPDRFRGVRQIALAHPDPQALRFLTHRPPPGLLESSAFRDAFRHLGPRGLVFDAAVLHVQLPEIAALADDFPGTTIVLDHAGLAMAMDRSAEERSAVFRDWRDKLGELARRPNVYCKIGGFGTAYWGFGFVGRTTPVGYEELAAVWSPYIETAVAAFGAGRCMAESNFPNDGRSCGFAPLWNALKWATRGFSAPERAALFHDTAIGAYRIAML